MIKVSRRNNSQESLTVDLQLFCIRIRRSQHAASATRTYRLYGLPKQSPL
ncbi:MAG: hypothetical protein ACAF41_23435 [Leptolyngbya sp. BL-A-14]